MVINASLLKLIKVPKLLKDSVNESCFWSSVTESTLSSVRLWTPSWSWPWCPSWTALYSLSSKSVGSISGVNHYAIGKDESLLWERWWDSDPDINVSICFPLQPFEENDGWHVVRCHGLRLCSFGPDWDRRECEMCESDSRKSLLELHNLMIWFSSENIAQFPIILWEPAKGGEHVQQFTERDHLTQRHSSDRLAGGTTHIVYKHTHASCSLT